MTEKSSVTAFVLVTVPVTKSGDLVKTLMRDFPEVVEAAAVYGEADVVAKIEASSIERMHTLVMEEIQTLPTVEVTRTFIVIPQLHEMRDQ